MVSLYYTMPVGHVRCGSDTYGVYRYNSFARCVNCGSVKFRNCDSARNFLISFPANIGDAACSWRNILAWENLGHRH